MFLDKNKPTMSELIVYLMTEFTTLVDEMKTSTHSVKTSEPNPYHTGDDCIWTHTMMVCMQADMDGADKVNLIAALLHDTGKPMAREVIPFNKPKPIHTESNEIREKDKKNSKTKELEREFKVHMRGHEGISVYKAMDVLEALQNEGVIDRIDVEEILTIISLHGTLFDSIKDGEMFKPEKVQKKWLNHPKLFEKFVKQVRYDSCGRWAQGLDARTNNGLALGKTLYGKDFVDTLMEEDFHKTKILPENNITLLVGVPLSGKSTYIKENTNEDTVVISRDATLMEFGQLKYGSRVANPEQLSYSDIWSYLDNDDQKQIDKMIQNQFQIAVKSKRDIVIDMTNTSKKSRNKWLSKAPKNYYKRAVIFAVGYEEVLRRNKKRNEIEGKFIPEGVLKNMMKGFMVPRYDEVEDITWAHQWQFNN